MPEKIYSFNGKDITMNVCIQIRDVIKLLQQHFHITFEEAVLRFYKSETLRHIKHYRKRKMDCGLNQQNTLPTGIMKKSSHHIIKSSILVEKNNRR